MCRRAWGGQQPIKNVCEFLFFVSSSHRGTADKAGLRGVNVVAHHSAVVVVVIVIVVVVVTAVGEVRVVSTTSTAEAKVAATSATTVIKVRALEEGTHGTGDVRSLGALLGILEGVLELLTTEERHRNEDALAELLIDGKAEGGAVLGAALSNSDASAGGGDGHVDVGVAGENDGAIVGVADVDCKGLTILAIGRNDFKGDGNTLTKGGKVSEHLRGVEEVTRGLGVLHVGGGGDEAVTTGEGDDDTGLAGHYCGVCM